MAMIFSQDSKINSLINKFKLFTKLITNAKFHNRKNKNEYADCKRKNEFVNKINNIVGGDNEFGFEEDSYMRLNSQQSISESPEIDVKEILKEWCIPFQDLQFKERIRKGRHGDIYRGQWHGDVFIYTFDSYNQHNLNCFWQEVAQLCLIRHENVMLFMGTCIDTSHLAVITSMCKGHSLYHQIHIKNQCISMNFKFNICRQIAQGMGYLHARGIVHKRLNSINVIIENLRVKICLMDQAMPKVEYDRDDWGCIPRGHLSYISPELMRSLKLEPPYLYPEGEFSQESDVYAFGTLLYEIINESFPFQGMDAHTVIYCIGSDNHDNVSELKCSSALKGLILQCWSANKSKRPKFQFIVRQLIENVPLQKQHSSSEPDRLNKTGLLSMSRALCS